MRFPPDRLCDIVFYDSLYANKANTFQSARFAPDLRRVLKAFKSYRVTERGLAVAHTGADKATMDISSMKGKATFRKLWASGVYHYGVLDFIPTNRTGERDMVAMLRLLKNGGDSACHLAYTHRHQ
ncbi:hypothetical protein V5799_007173 [Amblyomma americanum]|uniref:Uncharacterized protein n=1 Tax=Amblyomma americanum TaxID=6943 RepID=A0AAQ4DUA6_AMBAM